MSKMTKEEYDSWVIEFNKNKDINCVGGMTADGMLYRRSQLSGLLEPFGGWALISKKQEDVDGEYAREAKGD